MREFGTVTDSTTLLHTPAPFQSFLLTNRWDSPDTATAPLPNQPSSWPATLGQSKCILVLTFFIQVILYPLDHLRSSDTGNHLHSTPAFEAGVDIHVALKRQAFRSGHRGGFFGRHLSLCLVWRFALAAFPTVWRVLPPHSGVSWIQRYHESVPDWLLVLYLCGKPSAFNAGRGLTQWSRAVP